MPLQELILVAESEEMITGFGQLSYMIPKEVFASPHSDSTDTCSHPIKPLACSSRYQADVALNVFVTVMVSISPSGSVSGSVLEFEFVLTWV